MTDAEIIGVALLSILFGGMLGGWVVLRLMGREPEGTHHEGYIEGYAAAERHWKRARNEDKRDGLVKR